MEKKYVLIVDKDPRTVDALGRLLEQKGYEVGKACDGLDVRDSIRKRTPDLLVLDVTAPHKNGFALCSELKKDEFTRAIPVVLLDEAAGGRSVSRAEGRATEADDYIVKSGDARSLLEALERLVS